MESTISRTRSMRSSYPSRRRRGRIESDGRIARILKQLIISLAIFIVALTIKNLDTSYTNYLTDQITVVLTKDTEFSEVYSSMKQLVASLNVTNDKIRSVFNNQGSVTEQKPLEPVVIPTEMKDKVTEVTPPKDKEYAIPTIGVITSRFGNRISPITKQKEFHEGIDIDAKEGQEVKAIYDGQVVEAKNSPSLGKYIKINHGDDLVAIYAHTSALLVKEGQSIKKGDVIAKAGNTGQSVGPHLHIEIRKGEKLVNPEQLINFNKSLVDIK